MRRQAAVEILTRHKSKLVAQYAVRELSLFGSTARDVAEEDSDVDLLVSFDGPATSARYFGLQFYLEDVLGHRVDLVTDRALRSELKPYIEKDLIHV